MKTLIALIAVFFGSILSENFNWFESVLACFITVGAVLNDLYAIGQKASKKKLEDVKNELIEMSEENE